ncbi:Uma2 family endonuclease [Phorcysia thermohydrogeniphila]|uniref:Putative restriction endonuclease n=1 Tax=Phorcysia thermohydrogeniphila TaxID=936138 RepID=A0A4R1G9K7_9BACT|nr:Uma2 family endonuclease [Phorcysia thermohydrogeniphila]TCK03293.1 putative restriction endonuclease [Phorcysia thermohydrogeniphila]
MSTTQVKGEKKTRRGVPRELIYEMRYGKPIYYRDYDKVLAGEKTLEEVMGSSKLQWWVISIMLSFLYQTLDNRRYAIATNEVGFQWAPRTWRNLDIAIFEREKILKEGINEKDAQTPPKVVIEVDTKADLRKYGDFMNYAREKIQDLLDAGVEKVIWYTTFDKKVMVAEKGKRWFITDWNEDVEIIDGINFSLGKELKKSTGRKVNNS